jgi:hypothetical protein
MPSHGQRGSWFVSWRRHVAVAALIVLVFSALVSAAHLHRPDDDRGDIRDSLCALCLHVEHPGAGPAGLLLLAFLQLAAVLLPVISQPLCLRRAPGIYRARAPPVLIRQSIH